jgi:hypothetical protein
MGDSMACQRQALIRQRRAIISIWQGFGVATQNSTGTAKALGQNHQPDALNFKNSCNDNRDLGRLNLCNAILSQHYSVRIHAESSINSHK